MHEELIPLQKCPPPPSNLMMHCGWDTAASPSGCLAEAGLLLAEPGHCSAFSWKELVRHCCLVEYRRREDKKSICIHIPDSTHAAFLLARPVLAVVPSY